MKSEDDYFLLSRTDVEERFGICKRYLEIADSKGQGPRRVQLGRSVRYRVKDIRDWIDKCSSSPSGEERQEAPK